MANQTLLQNANKSASFVNNVCYKTKNEGAGDVRREEELLDHDGL